MSKALLLVICDFLLLSLLALAKFDTEDPLKAKVDPDRNKAEADPQKDLLEALKMSLEEERQARQEMDNLLKQAREQLQSSQSQVVKQETQLQQTHETLRSKEEEARREAAERAALEKLLQSNRIRLAQVQQNLTQSQTNLADIERKYSTTSTSLEELRRQFEQSQKQLNEAQAKYDLSRSSIETLQKQLSAAKSDARVNQQVVDALQQDLSKQVQEATILHQQVQQLDQTRQALTVEKEKLSGQLQVVQTEKRLTQEQLQTARQEVVSVKEEKATIQKQTAQLAKNVTSLANRSDEIKEEIRQNRPLTPNVIYSEFSSNRVHSSFQGTRPGIFGQQVKKDQVTRTILVRNGKQIYAVYHISELPLDFSSVGTEWTSLFGTFRRGNAYSTMSSLAFLDRDPRILIAPVNDTQARELGCKIYPIAKDLFKFDQAVLVGTSESYYGECSFRIDPETPGYMRMERERFGRLFGKFVPSKGDLVFSKQGELIGVMANNDYCLVFDNLQASRVLQLGANLAQQRPADLLIQLYNEVTTKPFRLQ
jgi:hypothetical protein